ncbi:hypothetical protein PF004_g31501, partial [Phytophthora fragariae]
VVKWARPYLSPCFHRPGALKCWIQILNSRLPTPQPNKIRTIAPAEVIRALGDYLNPEHPWQQYRRRLPSTACLFDTEGFDPDRKVSQRAPPFLRLQGYWSNSRGDGNSEDVDLGFSLWKRDHWIPRRVVEAFFKLAYRILEENDTWSAKQKAVIKRDLDAAKAAWLEYAVDRTRRSDRLRAKIVHQVWEWAVSKSPKFAKVDPEVLFEPSMPGYSYEYLTWIPKTMNWVDEIADLDEAEPWRIGWIDVPEQHPYNTTFAPCNLDVPLFVPADKTREAVGRLITVSPSLMVGEIAWGWDADFRGQNADSEAPESSAVVSNSSSRQASLNCASAGNLSSLQALAQAASAALSEAEDADEAEEED